MKNQTALLIILFLSILLNLVYSLNELDSNEDDYRLKRFNRPFAKGRGKRLDNSEWDGVWKRDFYGNYWKRGFYDVDWKRELKDDEWDGVWKRDFYRNPWNWKRRGKLIKYKIY